MINRRFGKNGLFAVQESTLCQSFLFILMWGEPRNLILISTAGCALGIRGHFWNSSRHPNYKAVTQ